MKIDYDKGVTIRTDPGTGAKIYMYKKVPGVFMNAHGDEVTPKLARAAGFNTSDLLKERAKREAMAKAMGEIEQEFESQKAEKKEHILEESPDGYKVVSRAFGRCYVLGPDGEELNNKPLTKQEAMKLWKEIVNTPIQDDGSEE